MDGKKLDGLVGVCSERLGRLAGRADARLRGACERLDGKNALNLRLMGLLALVCFALMLFFNIETPLAADDFDYRLIFGTADTAVSDIGDIFVSMRAHYFLMNGRLAPHFLVQLFILLGKPVFNVVNAAVYVGLTLLIYKHCVGKTTKPHSFTLFLAINLAVWTFSPAWGQATVWLDGSVNYMWGTAVRLAALLPFRLYADDGRARLGRIKTPLMPVLCLVAGNTNENTAAAMIGMMALFIVYYKIKGFRLPAWSFTGTAGAAVGFLLMLLSPANSGRVEKWAGEGNRLAERLVNIPGNAVLYFSALAAVFVILALILREHGASGGAHRIGIGFIYVLGALAGAGVMLASPYFPSRAWFGLIVGFVVADGFLLYQLRCAPELYRRAAVVAFAFWSLWCAMSCVKAAQDAVAVRRAYDARVACIEAEKAAGETDVSLPVIHARDAHSPLYGVSDVSENPDNWSNVSKAKYYGLDSITARP